MALNYLSILINSLKGINKKYRKKRKDNKNYNNSCKISKQLVINKTKTKFKRNSMKVRPGKLIYLFI